MTLDRKLQWEFWPWWIFYGPVYLYYLWLSLKARSLVFFSAANPTMELGGLVGYSKFDILKRVPEKYRPVCLHLEGDIKLPEIIRVTSKVGVTYPFILKPNQGERGYAVEKICSKNELDDYLERFCPDDIIIQEYIAHPVELGIMYSRMPGEEKGKITSIVIKKFLSVRGDGNSSIQQLIKSDSRSNKYLKLFSKRMGIRINRILPEGYTLELDAIGNHCRGTTFLNGNHLINEDLESIFDRISLAMKVHFFGRFDLRVASLQDLYNGESLKILEVNGANSEPAHIYDPEMPIIRAYKHLFKHWKRLYHVSIANRQMGIPYTGFNVGVKELIEYFARKRRRRR